AIESNAAAVSAAAAARGLRARFVHGQRAATQFNTVDLGDRLLGFLIAAHLDERESARAASRLIAHHRHRLHRARLREQRLQSGFVGLVRQVSYIKFSTHYTNSCAANAAPSPDGPACTYSDSSLNPLQDLLVAN